MEPALGKYLEVTNAIFFIHGPVLGLYLLLVQVYLHVQFCTSGTGGQSTYSVYLCKLQGQRWQTYLLYGLQREPFIKTTVLTNIILGTLFTTELS